MEYTFTEIFDIPSLTQLCESYTATNGVVTALLDLEGNVHVKTGWQDICTQFHRVHPTSSKRCTESDTILAGQLKSGGSYNVYHCKNGLVDVAVPVMVDGEHVANFFTGQFLFEQANKEQFIQQGKKLGYELIPYIDALNKVPVFKEEEIRTIMDFLVSLAQIIGEMGKAKLDLLKLQKSEHEKVLQLEAAQSQLEKLASQDPLTGLNNRRIFTQRLHEEFSRAHRYQHALSLAMIDTDFFKVINDSHGHSVGDQVLLKIAQILQSSVRNSDIVARIGGDEFCIIFPETNLQDTKQALHKVHSNLAKATFSNAIPGLKVTCSIGLAHITDNCLNAETLLIEADKALYQAKHQGRNRITEYASTEDGTSRTPLASNQT